MKRYIRRNGFTLVEVLVSVSILSFIILILAEMIGVAGNAWQQGVSRANNFTKSRAMLDLITSDLQRAVIRPDLPIFQTAGIYNGSTGGFSGGSFSQTFYTMVPGVSATSERDLSCVSYNVVTTTDTDKIYLQRSDLPIPWTGGAIPPFQGDLTASSGSATPREMAPGVVGFQFSFRQATGTITTTYTGYNAASPVVAVGVTIAVVGDQGLKQLSSGNLITIQNSLAGYVTGASSISSVKSLWDSKLTTSFYAPYPKTLSANLKTFERWVVPVQPF